MNSSALRTVLLTDIHSAFGIPHFYELLGNENCEIVGLVLGSAMAGVTSNQTVIDKWGLPQEANPVLEANAKRIPVLHAEKGKMQDLANILRSLHPHVLISAGFRSILPREILDIPEIAAVNFHPSLLPKMRGCDPWFWTILEGETESAATVHFMVEQVDAGDIILQTVIPVAPKERAGTLFQKTLVESLRLVAPLLKKLRSGSVPRIKQDESKASTFGPPRPEDYRIDWKKPSKQIVNLIRAAKYEPGAWTTFKSREVIVTEAELGTDPSLAEYMGMPGSVIKASAQALVVHTGSGNVVIRMLDHGGQHWNAAKFATFFRCGTCPDLFV